MSSVGTEFPKEQARCREILKNLQSIGPAGMFGAMVITQALTRAEEAQASGDVAAIVRSYAELKDFKE